MWEAAPPTRVAEAALQPRQTTTSGAAGAQTTPSGAADAQPTPDEPMNQAKTSSSTIVGGEQVKRPGDPTVEGEIPMSEVRRPRGRPITRILPVPGTVEYTEGCPGWEKATTTTHRVAERAASASHVGGAIQTASHAAGRAASSSQVSGAT